MPAIKTNTIYVPRGKAREYAELACNLYRGCAHGCRYCYAPKVLRLKPEEFRTAPRPRAEILAAVEKDAKKLAGDKREVLLCFTSDPYQPAEREHRVTRAAIEILHKHRLAVRVLTKNPALAVELDLDLLLAADVKLGTTVCFRSEALRAEWEPGAPPLESRWLALQTAHRVGLWTWCSVEPVIDHAEGLAAIRWMARVADEIKVGKINHRPEVEARTDWPRFAAEARDLLRAVGVKWLLKESLASLLGPDPHYAGTLSIAGATRA